MYIFLLSVLLILVAIGDWRADPFPKSLRLLVVFILLYGLDIGIVLMQFWDVQPPNLSLPIIWLLDPVVRPVFEWLKGGTM